MKIKKESIEKVILGILTFILIVYISFNFILLTAFNISKKILNKDNVSDFISKIDIIEILRSELSSEIGEFSLIEEEFQDVGITSEGINEFINSDDVNEFSSQLVINVIDNLVNNEIISYEVSADEISKLVENNIDALQTKSSLTQKQLLDKLNSKMPSLVEKINNLVNSLCEKLRSSEIFAKYQNYINMSIGILDIVYSDIVYALIIFVLISFIALLIFIRRNIYKSLKWISVSFIVPSIMLFILMYITHNISVDNSLINNVFNQVCKSLNKYAIVYLLISIILIIINIIMYLIIKRKNKKG